MTHHIVITFVNGSSVKSFGRALQCSWLGRHGLFWNENVTVLLTSTWDPQTHQPHTAQSYGSRGLHCNHQPKREAEQRLGSLSLTLSSLRSGSQCPPASHITHPALPLQAQHLTDCAPLLTADKRTPAKLHPQLRSKDKTQNRIRDDVGDPRSGQHLRNPEHSERSVSKQVGSGSKWWWGGKPHAKQGQKKTPGSPENLCARDNSKRNHDDCKDQVFVRGPALVQCNTYQSSVC